MCCNKLIKYLVLSMVQTAIFVCTIQTALIYAATMASVDASGGYAAKVLDKVLAVWAPPPALKSNFEVRVKISIDGKGNLKDCKTTKKSGLDALDTSTCGSVKQVAPFASPPDGKAVEVHMAFWTGMPKGKFREQPPSPEEAVRAEIRARTKAESLIGTQAASSAESVAKQRAEAVALKSGKPLPEIDEIPIAPPSRAGKGTNNAARQQNMTIIATRHSGNKETLPENINSQTRQKAVTHTDSNTGMTNTSARIGQNASETGKVQPEKKLYKQPSQEKSVANIPNELHTNNAKTGKSNSKMGEKADTGSTRIKNDISSNNQAVITESPKENNHDQNVFMTLANSASLPEVTDPAYLHKIRWQIREVTYVPIQAKPGEYKTTVKILVDGQGNIKDSAIVSGSGSSLVDSYIMRGISRRIKVTPPPGGCPATCEIKFTLVRHNNEEPKNSGDSANKPATSGKTGDGQTKAGDSDAKQKIPPAKMPDSSSPASQNQAKGNNGQSGLTQPGKAGKKFQNGSVPAPKPLNDNKE